MPTQKLTPEFINAAIEGFESQKRRIDAQLSELKQLLRGDSTGAAVVSEAPRHARKISAAGRRKIAAAQRARWAKVRGEGESAASETSKRKGRLSAAGSKAISEATKRRWALIGHAHARWRSCAMMTLRTTSRLGTNRISVVQPFGELPLRTSKSRRVAGMSCMAGAGWPRRARVNIGGMTKDDESPPQP